MKTQKIAKIETELTVNNANFNKGFDDSKTRMRQYNRMAGTTSKNNKTMADSFRNAGRNVAAFQGPMGGVSSRLSSIASLFGSLNPLIVGAGLAFTAMSAMALSSVRELDEYELRLAKTEAIIRATGGAAGLTADQVAQLADDVAENTLASVKGVLDASNTLLTFKSIQGDVFKNAIGLSQDLSAVMGTDIKSSALQLGKALEDPITGLTSLRRAGVSFTESQKDMIKNMIELGNLAGAQKYILAELATQIGGAGEAESSDSVAGASDLAAQRWEELQKQFSKTFALKSAAKSFFNTLAEGFSILRRGLAGTSDEKRLQDIAERLGEINEALGKYARKEKAFGKLSARDKRNLNDLTREQLKLRTEGSRLQDITIQKIKDESAAVQKGEEAKLKNKNEKAAELLAADQKAGLATITALDSRLANEEEKINQSWERREQKIQDLVLAEHEIKSRGYQSLEELKDSYRALSDEKLDEDFAKIEEKEQAARDRKTKADEDAANKELALKKAVNNQIEKNERQLSGNLLAIGYKLAGDNKNLQLSVFAFEKIAAITRAYLNTSEGVTKANAVDPTGALATKVAATGYGNIAAMSALALLEGGAMASGGSGLSSSAVSSADPVSQDYAALTTADSSNRREVIIQNTVEIHAMDGASVQAVVDNNPEIFVKPVLDHIEETGGL